MKIKISSKMLEKIMILLSLINYDLSSEFQSLNYKHYTVANNLRITVLHKTDTALQSTQYKNKWSASTPLVCLKFDSFITFKTIIMNLLKFNTYFVEVI